MTHLDSLWIDLCDVEADIEAHLAYHGSEEETLKLDRLYANRLTILRSMDDESARILAD